MPGVFVVVGRATEEVTTRTKRRRMIAVQMGSWLDDPLVAGVRRLEACPDPDQLQRICSRMRILALRSCPQSCAEGKVRW